MTEHETPRDPDTELGGYDNPNPPYTDDAWAMVAGAFPGKQPEHIPGQLSIEIPEPHRNTLSPNFRGHDGRLYLVRCYECAPYAGRENWSAAVASGTCGFCGWHE